MLSPTAADAFEHTLHTVLLAVLCIPFMSIAGMFVAINYANRKPHTGPKKRREIIRAGFKIGGLLGLILVWPLYRAFI